MDRGKLTGAARGPKGKVTQQPPDTFIALGAKSSSGRDADSKRNVPLPKHVQTGTSKGVPERKRETSASALPPPKKVKVGVPARPGGIGGAGAAGYSGGDRVASAAPDIEAWEALAIDCESFELLESFVACTNSGNIEKAVAYILGAIKATRTRFKPCKILYNNILLMCQCKPALFTHETVVTAIANSLKRDIASTYKTAAKGNMYNQLLYVNLLMYAFADEVQWPELFVKLYAEDALGDRVWIDNPLCKPFVENVVTAFNTKQPPKLLLMSDTWATSGRDTSSPLTVNSLEDDEGLNEFQVLVESWKSRVFSRYAQAQEVVEKISLEAIQEQIARRQQPEAITKNFVKFLSIACGLVEIRMLAASRLETWLHNHKLMKPAQELLAYVCYNCPARTQRDMEVVAQLSKLRLKTKPLINLFNNCLKEMVIVFPENLYLLLKTTIYNELSNVRNTNNLLVISAMFQVAPDACADAFADICIELLLNKDDYLRSLRSLIKEINRVLRYDFNLLSVVHALLRDRPELYGLVRDIDYRERVFHSLADLTCMCMLLCVSPQVRDAGTQSKRDYAVLNAFQIQVSNIQRESVTWLYDSAVRMFHPVPADFVHALQKVLFLVQADEYHKIDSWPGENERLTFLRLASEVPLMEVSLLRLLLIGLSKEHPVGQTDIIEILDSLIRRAANLVSDSLPALAVENLEIADLFFNLCSYNPPENIVLPAGYAAPTMAITSLYWKTWLMLLIVAAHNPSTFGSLAWNKYPTLKTLMEMCITNHFLFPPPTMLVLEGADEFASKELQINSLERQKIIEFESHLAAASTKVEITEQSSLLLSQLVELKPQGDARKPPATVLEQLQVLNASHRLGHLLCRSRNPDFLLDIMSRQGGTAHMPWLAELVQSSEGAAFSHLPVQCLCEYLLSTFPSTEKVAKHGQLLAHLRAVVAGADPQNALEVLEYLLRRLASIHASSRVQAIRGLTLILSNDSAGGEADITSISADSTKWLIQHIPAFPHLGVVRPLLVQFLRQSLFVETSPVHVSSYVGFLCSQSAGYPMPELLDLVFDLASLIVERTCVTGHILPGQNMETLKPLISLFCVYLRRARQPTDETFHWSESQDQVIVSWSNGEQCTLQILIVHASIILLTYGPIDDFAHFDELIDTWFPVDGNCPKAYLVDTSEEALLVPDWLKLRMIRSDVPRLVDAAIDKLEASQLVLFIQSFGIPVDSTSKLLQALDRATVVDTKLVVVSVLDKNYMTQLVDVQNRRGATGGEIFVKALDLQGLNESDGEDVEMKASKARVLALNVQSTKPYCVSDNNTGNIVAAFNSLISSSSVSKREFRSLLKMLSADPEAPAVLFRYLGGMSQDSIRMLESDPQYSVAVFKLLLSKIHPIDTSAILKLLEMCKDKSSQLAGVLRRFLDSEAEVKMELEDESSELKYNNKVEMNLLFSKSDLQFRPLLMSLLLQRSSWSLLYGMVVKLLSRADSGCCPVSTLDFLAALRQSPKLWQGRDKAVPKHYHVENVLRLDTSQLIVLVKYMLEEAETNRDNWQQVMERRLPILLENIGSSAEDVTSSLLTFSADNEKACELALMLYMAIPATGSLSKLGHGHDVSVPFSKASSCVVDVISHTLISALASTPRSKDWTRKSQDLELCTRKLVSAHPELVLRQLPMLAGSLRGRAQYGWNVLRNRGHLQLFAQVLGLLELMQPAIFGEHRTTLCSVLDSFFTLMQFHGHIKELSTMLNHIFAFLQNWVAKDASYALRYLQRHSRLLSDLQAYHPSVRPLLSCVSLPIQDPNAPSCTVVPSVQEPLPQQWPDVLSGLKQLNLSALQDLDHLTAKRPRLLRDVSRYLYNGLESPSSVVRTLSLQLLVRLLRFDPGESSKALPAVLACLNSGNAEVVATVLDRLPELVASMQEHAKVILRRAFRLGVWSNSNVASNISKSISFLSLQFGY